MPLDEEDNDDSDDEEDPPEPMDTEESHLTTEDSIPDAVVGQIFVKTLTGKTIAVNDVTTKTKIIDIKNTTEEKDGLPTKVQRLKYQNTKVKDKRTVGYYNSEKDHTLHFTGRLRGGGKRAASRVPKQDMLTKEEKVKEKIAALQLTLIQLQQMKSTYANPIAAHVEEAINQGKTVVKESLYHMPVPSLHKLVAHAATSNNETTRIDFIARQIFITDFGRIENMNKAMKLCDTAIRTTTVIKFYENYMTKCGRLSWENYKGMLEQVPTIPSGTALDSQWVGI